MKIQTKLIIGFLIMTAFPLFLTSITVSFVLDRLSNDWRDVYNIEKDVTGPFDIIMNPINFFYEASNEDYDELVDITVNDPDSLLHFPTCKKLNDNMKKHQAYLLVLKEKKYIYTGCSPNDVEPRSIPVADIYHRKAKDLVYLDNKTNSIIRERTFYFSDHHTLGQIMMVTDYSKLNVAWNKTILQFLAALIIMMFMCDIALGIWIYQSIVKPINLLQIATIQIGDGNLDIPVTPTSKDEIGELCKDFDNMRLRLKELIDDNIRREENIRTMLSNISHDLKTPITAIQGYTEGILDGVADTEEKRIRYLQTIYAKANDMTYLIDELSLYSKMEQNSLPYDFISVNAEQFFSDCIEDVSLDLEAKDIHIFYENKTDKHTCLLIDPEQIKRVLNNLIENACKYMGKPSGKIHICLFDESSQPEMLHVSVTDTGAGIPKEHLPHIFERFYRADSSRNSAIRGSGLGLAIVKGIINDHGGTITAESKVGVGSCFTFTLKKTK